MFSKETLKTNLGYMPLVVLSGVMIPIIIYLIFGLVYAINHNYFVAINTQSQGAEVPNFQVAQVKLQQSLSTINADMNYISEDEGKLFSDFNNVSKTQNETAAP